MPRLPSTNFPNPWPGGTWRLRDIVEMELTTSFSVLKSAAQHAAMWVENFYDLGRRAVEKGRTEPPFAYIVPEEQHDPHTMIDMLRILDAGGVEVHQAV